MRRRHEEHAQAELERIEGERQAEAELERAAESERLEAQEREREAELAGRRAEHDALVRRGELLAQRLEAFGKKHSSLYVGRQIFNPSEIAGYAKRGLLSHKRLDEIEAALKNTKAPDLYVRRARPGWL